MDYDNFVGFLSFTATASTVAMFLCGLQICFRIRNRGSTDGTGVAPFFLTSISCICWLGYGILRRDRTVIFVNGIGLVFQTVYLTYYYVKTRLKARLNRLIFSEMIISVLTAIVINGNLFSENEKENLLGIVCMFLNIATIASPLVDLGQVVRTKSTESLPFMLCLANLAVCVQWLLYGFLVDDFYMKVRIRLISIFYQVFPLFSGPEYNWHFHLHTAVVFVHRLPADIQTTCGWPSLIAVLAIFGTK